MSKALSFIVCAVAALAVGVANAATMEYRMLINGTQADSHVLVAGSTNTLAIEGRVLDNILTGTTNGGIFQAAVNIDAATDGVLEFVQEEGFLGGTGNWESTFNPDLTTALKGVLNGNGYSVFAQTGAVNPGSYAQKATAVGATDWSSLFSGQFKYLGGLTVLNLTAIPSENLVASFSGSLGARNPEAVNVVGNGTVIGVPEPATFAMAGLGAIGMLAASRRRS